MAMFEKAEDEYNILISMKNIIEVNKDFGSIFSTLLPGTMAKLEPLEGYSLLDGFIFGFASFQTSSPERGSCSS
ncbi:Structural maintenance of chromosomes protein 2 [Orobanche minor]